MREQFGDYLLIDRIATGGMGEIFLARLEREDGFEKQLVIKRMLPHLTRSKEFVSMFQSEARIAAQLSHQNIVQIFDFGQIGSSYFIAMEYVDGLDLRSLLEDSRPEGEAVATTIALEIASACAAGLDYAHRRVSPSGTPLGIIHRDISPQNILISFEGEVKLADFGLAKAKLQAEKSESGSIKGKYSYLAPEQVLGRPVDQRSDLFSLGVVIYEMIFGRKLFPLRESLGETLDRIGRCELPDLESEGAALPPRLVALLRRVLAGEPDDRFENAGLLREEIESVRLEMVAESTPVALSSFMRSRAASLRPPTAEFDETVISRRPIAKRKGDERVLGLEGTGSIPRRRPRRWRWLAATMVVAGILVVALYFALREGERVPRATASDLEVVSSPGGAAIWLDGKPTGRRTPTMLRALQGDKTHTVELRLDGHETALWRGRVPPDGRVDLELTPRWAKLAVRSEPDGAMLFVDEKRVGTTPWVIDRLSFGPHRIRLSRPGFGDWVQVVRIDRSSPPPLRAQLAPAARLTIETTPAGARVELGGRTVEGSTPLVAGTLSPGASVAVVIRKAGYRTVRRTLRVPATGRRLSVRLQRLALELGIGVVRGRRRVFLNREFLGQTPLGKRRLPFGEHLLRLVDDAGRKEVRIRLKALRGTPAGRLEALVVTLHARPWAKVRIGKRSLGAVPVSNRPIGLGRHQIELRRADGSLETVRLRLVRESSG